MSAEPALPRLQEGDGTEDSTQRGCTSWLLISCVVLTLTTSFVFGWGLGAPNMYNRYTERFLEGEDPCVTKVVDRVRAETISAETTAAVLENAAVTEANDDNVGSTTIPTSDGVVQEKSDHHKHNHHHHEHSKSEEKFDFWAELIKGIPQTIFLIGAFIGAITGPFWVKIFDRKRTVFANYIFCFASSLCVLLAYYFNKPLLFFISRFLLGYQGGMACVTVPPFLGEISSQRVRGAAGAAFQLSLTIGILSAQVIGLPYIAGGCDRWGWGLAIVFLLPLAGMFVLFLLPNSPTQMVGKYNNEEQAIIDLKKLRGTNNIQADMDVIREQTRQVGGGKTESLSIPQVLKSTHYRWPMLTTVMLQTAQALSGINAVFFYSSKMFEKAGIKDEYIPFANIGTGLINVIATIVAISLIEKLGRRPLIIYPMAVMLGVFAILVGLVELNKTRNSTTLGLISVLFILIFIICFAVGLGPIPFLYGTEVCRPEARDSVQSIGLTCNYFGNILLSLFFPALNSILGGYVFLIFFVLVLLNLIFFWFKMPETKNKTVEDAERFWKIPSKNPNEKLLPPTATA